MIDKIWLVENPQDGETPGIFPHSEYNRQSTYMSGIRGYSHVQTLDLDSTIEIYVNVDSAILAVEAINIMMAFCKKITFYHQVSGEWMRQDCLIQY